MSTNVGTLFVTMLNFVGRALMKLGRMLVKPTPSELRALPWFRDQGDKTHRVLYDLTERSVVIDLGGYEGQWASDIFAMYCCSIHVFEPVPEFAGNITKRFARNPRIVVHEFGLGAQDSTIKISLNGASSTQHHGGGHMVDACLMMASKFFESYHIEKVDLMKINIEGGEYDLLDHLIETCLVTRIKNLQIQFHDFVPQAEERVRKIRQALMRTHRLTYQYEFVWENWELK